MACCRLFEREGTGWMSARILNRRSPVDPPKLLQVWTASSRSWNNGRVVKANTVMIIKINCKLTHLLSTSIHNFRSLVFKILLYMQIMAAISETILVIKELDFPNNSVLYNEKNWCVLLDFLKKFHIVCITEVLKRSKQRSKPYGLRTCFLVEAFCWRTGRRQPSADL